MDIEELQGLFIFDGLSEEQLGELVGAGEEVRFTTGDRLFVENAPADAWWVLLEGRIELTRRIDHTESVAGAMERPGVWAGGFHAWTDSAGYMATGCATSDGRILRVPAQELGRIVGTWFPFGVHLIKGFFQTVRNMDAMARERAGLVSLGKIAAGLAHELNNPAASAARAADTLQETCTALLASLVALAERSLTSQQFVALDELRRTIEPPVGDVDPLAAADREDELLDWLESRDVDDAWRIAPTLAAADVSTEWCEKAASILDEATLGHGLDWVAGTLSVSTLLREVSESTRRVSNLVDNVRSYSQVDRASLQLIDVTEGIDSTLVVLGHKLGDGITIERRYATDLPRIEAMPSALNQVWTNLIDNAIDAMEGAGTLRIEARVEHGDLVVEIADTGPGMPADVQARSFEAFFTTKDVGHGTGLGLDISRRVIAEVHSGDITIDSSPAGTSMIVRLPLSRPD